MNDSNTAAPAEEKRNAKIARLIKLGIVMSFFFIVWLFATIAWFAVNTSTTGSGMVVTITDMPFDIGTKGGSIRNETQAKSLIRYNEGVADEISSEIYYDKTDKLLLRYDPSGTSDEIAPGSCGELSLYLLPKNNDEMSARISLDITSYAEIEKLLDDDGNTIDYGDSPPDKVIIKIDDDFAVNVAKINNKVRVSDYTDASKYLKGHIMFFGEEYTTTSTTTTSTTTSAGDTTTSTTTTAVPYYYAKPYTDRILTHTVPSGSKDTAVKVPIYWMWPNTLGQLALKNNISERRSGPPVVEDTASDISSEDFKNTDKYKVISYLKNNKDKIFLNYTEVSLQMIDSADDSANFKKLSSGYNKADFLIGSHIAFFTIEVTVDNYIEN